MTFSISMVDLDQTEAAIKCSSNRTIINSNPMAKTIQINDSSIKNRPMVDQAPHTTTETKATGTKCQWICNRNGRINSNNTNSNSHSTRSLERGFKLQRRDKAKASKSNSLGSSNHRTASVRCSRAVASARTSRASSVRRAKGCKEMLVRNGCGPKIKANLTVIWTR